MYQSASLELPISSFSIFYFFDVEYLSIFCLISILILYITTIKVKTILKSIKVEPLRNLNLDLSQKCCISEYVNLIEQHKKQLPMKYKLLRSLYNSLSIALYIVVIITIIFIFEFLIINFTKSSELDSNNLKILEMSLKATKPTQSSDELILLINDAKIDGSVTKYEYIKLAKKVAKI